MKIIQQIIKFIDAIPRNRLTILTIVISAVILLIATITLLYGPGLLKEQISLKPLQIQQPDPDISNGKSGNEQVSPVIVIQNSTECAQLFAELSLDYDGWRILLYNNGTATAYNIYLYLESWADGAPASSIFYKKEISSLMPKGERKFIITNLYDHHSGITCVKGSECPCPNEKQECRLGSSGYFYIMCDNCDKPRGWLFHIPREGYCYNLSNTNQWPIIEFNYPIEKPRVGSDISEKYSFKELIECNL